MLPLATDVTISAQMGKQHTRGSLVESQVGLWLYLANQFGGCLYLHRGAHLLSINDINLDGF